MSIRLLNIIIVISMIGILLIAAKEKYYPSKRPAQITESKQEQVDKSKIDAVTATQSDSQVPCKSSYFNFDPKSTWKYKLSTGSTFTSTIATASASTVTIISKLPTTKEPLKSALTCKKSGIYGLPFIPIASKAIPQSVVDSILLIPNTKSLSKGQTWTSAIDIGTQIPFVAGNGITIKSTVEKVTDISATISSTLDLGSIPASLSPVGNGKILEYTITKGVGVSKLQLLVGKDLSAGRQDGKTGSGFEITLINYSQK